MAQPEERMDLDELKKLLPVISMKATSKLCHKKFDAVFLANLPNKVSGAFVKKSNSNPNVGYIMHIIDSYILGTNCKLSLTIQDASAKIGSEFTVRGRLILLRRASSYNRRILFLVHTVSRPVTRRGEIPLEKVSPLLEKCVGHRLKLLDIVKKIWAPLRKLFAPPIVACWLRVWL